jgi:uncharacterized membrane protein YbaN (DUF454 family)
MFLILTPDLTRFYLENRETLDSIRKIGLLVIGWLFIVLGILGLFLPFLQGILFILIGLAILSSRSEIIKRLLKHLEERYPHHYQRIENLREKIKGWFKKD